MPEAVPKGVRAKVATEKLTENAPWLQPFKLLLRADRARLLAQLRTEQGERRMRRCDHCSRSTPGQTKPPLHLTQSGQAYR